MELFETSIDRLASPLVLYSSALLLIVVATRTRFLFGRLGGVGLSALAAAVLGAGLADARFRALVLDPARLPALVLLLSTLAFLWLALHRPRGAEPRPAAIPAERPAGEAAVVVAAGTLLMAGAFFLDPPLGRSALDLAADASTVSGRTPWFLGGLHELGSYFEPWMADFGLPALLVAALLALPYLDVSAAAEDDPARERRRLMTFAAASLLLVLLPIVVATFVRGPHGIAFGPFEARDAVRPTPAPAVPLAEVFWCRGLGMSAPPAAWLLRELPGVLALTGWFFFLPWLLARWSATRKAVERYRKAVGARRYQLTLALALCLAIVPLKMYGRWLFGIGRWLDLPELSLSF
jgi:hypothetical protein